MTGAELKESRESMGMTVEDLAENLGLPSPDIYDMEEDLDREVGGEHSRLLELAMFGLEAGSFAEEQVQRIQEFLSPEATAARELEYQAELKIETNLELTKGEADKHDRSL
jgi:transcriptional regulator with XRE-family HTH domain